jgi:hypothetical protein
VDALNKLYGRQVIPLAEGISVKCDRAKELLKSMLTANYAEFLTVSHELQSNMQALQKLVAFLEALQRGMIADLKKSDSGVSESRANEFERISNTVIQEFQRKIAIISNALSIGIGNMSGPIDLTFKNFEPLDSFYKSLEAKGDEKASNIGQRMVGLIGTVGLITSIAAMVKDALKDVGMSVEEYGKVQNMQALDKSLESKLVAMKSQLDSKSLDAFLRAAELLRNNNFHHSNIMQYLKSEGGAEPRDNIHGGAESLTRRLARAKKSKELLSENMVRKLGTVLEGFAKSLDTLSSEVLSGQRELADSDKLRDFLDAVGRTGAEDAYDEQHVKYLSGELQDTTSTRLRSEFISNFERVVKTAGALGLSDIVASAKAVIGVIDTFTHLREVASKIGGSACFKAVGAAGYKVADSVDRIKLVRNRSNMLQSLSMSSKEQMKLNDDYFKILGEAMGRRIRDRVSAFTTAANDPSRDNMNALGVIRIGDDAEIVGNPLPPDPPHDVPELKSYLEHCSRVVRDFYKAVESLDLYLGDFADKAASEPHALANMNEALAQLRLIVDWEDTNSVTKFTDVFKQFKTYPKRGNGNEPRSNAPTAGAGPEVLAEGTRYDAGDDVDRAMPKFAAVYIKDWKDANKIVNASACSISPLKNVMSMVDSIGSQFSSGRVGSKAPMSVAKMWRAIQKFIVLSAFRLTFYNGYGAGRSHVAPGAIAAYAANSGYVLLLRDGRPKGRDRAEFNDPIVDEVELLKHSLKAMCSKVLVSVGVHCMVAGKGESRLMRPFHPIRQLLGGSEATVVPENVELYYSLGKAIQFYKKVFSILDPPPGPGAVNLGDKLVALVPHWDGVFKGLMDKVWGYSHDISSIQIDALIDETNKLRKSFSGKTPGEINRKVLMAFVAEINSRVGCYVKSEIESLKAEYAGRFAEASELPSANTSKNYKLFESEEYDGANAPSPSGQWIDIPEGEERDAGFTLETDIYISAIAKFRDAVYRVLAGVNEADGAAAKVATHFTKSEVLTGIRRYMENVKKTVEEAKVEERVGVVRNMLVSQEMLAGFSNPVPLGLVGMVSAPAELLHTLRGLFVGGAGDLKPLGEMPDARKLIKMGFVVRSDGNNGLVVDPAAFKRSYIELHGAASQIYSTTKSLWNNPDPVPDHLDGASKFVNIMRNVERKGDWDARVQELGSDWTWDAVVLSALPDFTCRFPSMLGPDMVAPVAFDRLRVSNLMTWGAENERSPNSTTSPVLADDVLIKEFTVALDLHGEFNSIIDQYLSDALDEGMGAMYKGSVERLISGSASDAIANRKGSTNIESDFSDRHPLHVNMAYALRRVMLERNAKGDVPRFQLELEDIPGYMKANYIASASQTRYNATELLKVCVQYKTFIKMFDDNFDTVVEDERLNVCVAHPAKNTSRGQNTWYMLDKIEATLHDLVKCVDRTLADFGDLPVFGETEPGSIQMYVSEHNKQPPVTLAALRQNVPIQRVNGDGRRKLYLIRQALLGKQAWGASLQGSLEAFNASVPESYKVSADAAKAVSDGIVALGLWKWDGASDNVLKWMRGENDALPPTSTLVSGEIGNEDTTAAAVFYESGILPINVHSLRATVPLSNLYNFSYTFTKTAELDTLGTNKLFRHLMFGDNFMGSISVMARDAAAPAAPAAEKLIEMYEYVSGGMGSNYIGLLRFVYHVYVETMTGPDYLGTVGRPDAQHGISHPSQRAALKHTYNPVNRDTGATGADTFSVENTSAAIFGDVRTGGTDVSNRAYALGVLDTMYTRLTFCTINMQAYLQAFILRELQRSMSPVASGAMRTLSTYVTSGDDGNSGNTFFGRLKVARKQLAGPVDRSDDPARRGGRQDANAAGVRGLPRTVVGAQGPPVVDAVTLDDVEAEWATYIGSLNRFADNDTRTAFARYVAYLGGTGAAHILATPHCRVYMAETPLTKWRDDFKAWVMEQDKREQKVAKLRQNGDYKHVVTKAVKARIVNAHARLHAQWLDIRNIMTKEKLKVALTKMYTLKLDAETIQAYTSVYSTMGNNDNDKQALDNYAATNIGALRSALIGIDLHTYSYAKLSAGNAPSGTASNVVPIPDDFKDNDNAQPLGAAGPPGTPEGIVTQGLIKDLGALALGREAALIAARAWPALIAFTKAMYEDTLTDRTDLYAQVTTGMNEYNAISATLGGFKSDADDNKLDIATLAAAAAAPGAAAPAAAELASANVYGYKALIFAKSMKLTGPLERWLRVNRVHIREYLSDMPNRLTHFDVDGTVGSNMGVMLMGANAHANHPLNTALMLAIMYETVGNTGMMTKALKSIVDRLSKWNNEGDDTLTGQGLAGAGGLLAQVAVRVERIQKLFNNRLENLDGSFIAWDNNSAQSIEDSGKAMGAVLERKTGSTDNEYYKWITTVHARPALIVEAVNKIRETGPNGVASIPSAFGLDDTVQKITNNGNIDGQVNAVFGYIEANRLTSLTYNALSSCLSAMPLPRPAEVNKVLTDYMKYLMFLENPGTEIGIPYVGSYWDAMADKAVQYDKWATLNDDRIKRIIRAAVASVGFLEQLKADAGAGALTGANTDYDFVKAIYNLANMSARTTMHPKLAMLAGRSAHINPGGGVPNSGTLAHYDNVIVSGSGRIHDDGFLNARIVRAIQTWVLLASKSDDLGIVSNLPVHTTAGAGANVNLNVNNLNDVPNNLQYQAVAVPNERIFVAIDKDNITVANVRTQNAVAPGAAMTGPIDPNNVEVVTVRSMGLGWHSVSRVDEYINADVDNPDKRHAKLASIINKFDTPATKFSMPN